MWGLSEHMQERLTVCSPPARGDVRALCVSGAFLASCAQVVNTSANGLIAREQEGAGAGAEKRRVEDGPACPWLTAGGTAIL
jgi:hypothetical protein